MKKSFFKIGLPAIIYFAFDQALKAAAQHFLSSPIVLTPWFSLRYSENYGIAWSIPVPHDALIVLNVGLLLAVPWLIARHIDLRHKSSQIFLSFIVGGALGNVFDRLTRGYVIDYISIGTFPIFNLADSLLTIGIFLIILFYAKIKR